MALPPHLEVQVAVRDVEAARAIVLVSVQETLMRQLVNDVIVTGLACALQLLFPLERSSILGMALKVAEGEKT
jgi:hypothetical protein